jgi:hypothetical protein
LTIGETAIASLGTGGDESFVTASQVEAISTKVNSIQAEEKKFAAVNDSLNNNSELPKSGGDNAKLPIGEQFLSDEIIDSDTKVKYVSPTLLRRFNRQSIYERAWIMPIVHFASEFNVSDSALVRACKKLYIPIPRRGYWARKSAGKPVEPRPPLPEVQESQDHLTSG